VKTARSPWLFSVFLLGLLACEQKFSHGGKSKTIEQWMVELSSKQPGLARGAAKALGEIGARTPSALSPSTVTTLKRALKDEAKDVRKHAAEALGEIQKK
jgi:hypothetical protein